MRIKKFFNESLFHRLVFYFMLLMMLPVLVSSALLYSASDVKLSDSGVRLAHEVVSNISESSQQILSEMEAVAKQIATDTIIQGLVLDLLSDDRDNEDILTRIDSRLKDISAIYPLFDGIYICLDNGMIARSRYYQTSEDFQGRALSDKQYNIIKNHEDIQWKYSDKGSFIVDNNNNPVLCAARMMSAKTGEKACGIVVIEVRGSYLKNILGSGFSEDGTAFLMSEKFDIMVTPNNADADIVEKAYKEVLSDKEGSGYIMLSDRVIFSEDTGVKDWHVIGSIMKQSLRDDSESILTVFAVMIFITFALTVFVSRFLAGFELKPIRRIQKYIEEMEEGEFGRAFDQIRKDEIGSLAQSVQEMSERIGGLLEKVKKEEERQRVAEFKALQAQINPHFLYNSLDSINWLIRKGNAKKATEMVSAMGSFFRIGLSKGMDIITVKEEVEHARSYLFIQRIRYESEFEYSVFMDPAVEKLYMPKLIIQPLVENSLYHGIKLVERKGLILIQIWKVNDDIEIEILDNGAGMDEEQLNSLTKSMEHRKKVRSGSYGVVNVNDRIRILAGSGYGISYTSEKDVGTSAKIKLPGSLKRID
jgi:two-component system sensor histidine kinase YesM